MLINNIIQQITAIDNLIELLDQIKSAPYYGAYGSLLDLKDILKNFPNDTQTNPLRFQILSLYEKISSTQIEGSSISSIISSIAFTSKQLKETLIHELQQQELEGVLRFTD